MIVGESFVQQKPASSTGPVQMPSKKLITLRLLKNPVGFEQPLGKRGDWFSRQGF
jgi:hypothetical protein